MKLGLLAGWSENLRFNNELPKKVSLTDLGREILTYPCRPEFALVLRQAKQAGVLPEALITLAVLGRESVWHSYVNDQMVVEPALHDFLQQHEFIPLQAEGISEEGDNTWTINTKTVERRQECLPRGVREYFAQGSGSDFTSTVNAVRTFYSLDKDGESDLLEWCKHHFLKIKNVREAIAHVRHLVEELGIANVFSKPLSFEEVMTSRQFNTSALTKALIAGFPHWVSWRMEGPFGNGHYCMQAFWGQSNMRIDNRSVCPADDLIMIVFPRVCFTGEWGPGTGFGGARERVRQTEVVIPMAAPIGAKWLEQIHPHLVNRQSGYALFNETTDQVEHQETIYWDWQKIRDGKVVTCDDESLAQDAFVDWLVRMHKDSHITNQELGSIVYKNREFLQRARTDGCFTNLGWIGLNLETWLRDWIKTKVAGASRLDDLNFESLRMDSSTREQIKTLTTENIVDALHTHIVGGERIHFNPEIGSLIQYLDLNKTRYSELNGWEDRNDWLRAWLKSKVTISMLRRKAWRAIMLQNDDMDQALTTWIESGN